MKAGIWKGCWKRPDLAEYNRKRRASPDYVNPMQGKHQSEAMKQSLATNIERNRKISDAHRGSKNWNWKGGVRKDSGFRNELRRDKKLLQMVYEDNIKHYGTLTCVYCGLPIDFGLDSIDHRVPVSRGGTNEYHNLVVACRICNFNKKNKTYDEYMSYLARF